MRRWWTQLKDAGLISEKKYGSVPKPVGGAYAAIDPLPGE